MASRYNELGKVSAVETFQNEHAVSKWDERFVSFRSPEKCPALETPILTRRAETVNNANIAYDPLGPNSNSVLSYFVNGLPTAPIPFSAIPASLVGYTVPLFP